MRVLIIKSTGVLLEMQSDATPGTLLLNAQNCGYDVHDIEEREVTPAEYAALLPVQRRSVRKSVIVARLQAAGKLEAAGQALDGDRFARERWYAADRPAIYADDPEALALLAAIGADPDVILAAE